MYQNETNHTGNGEYRYSYTNNGANYGAYNSAYNGAAPQKKPKKKGAPMILKMCAYGLAFGLVAGVAFEGVHIAGQQLFPDAAQTAASSGSAGLIAAEDDASVGSTQLTFGDQVSIEKTDAAAVAENCMPSIVSITNMSVQEVYSFFGTAQQEVTSAGSGIIVAQNDDELLIVTNNHVVAGSDTLTITFIDEESVEGKVKGADASHDVAVVAVDMDDLSSSTKSAIKTAVIGDSDSIRVGEDVIAIGNALGYGQSVTSGIVSALDRSVSDLDGLIQTDAAINPGNSGGALLNAAGELIGINTAKVSSTGSFYTASVESMGYAIPISDIKPIIDELMNRETRDKVAEEEQGILGVVVATVGPSEAQAYNMPVGVYVSEVSDGSGAKEAGMVRGDVITSVAGTTVTSVEGLQEALSYYRAGETVSVTVQRADRNGEYEEVTMDVTLIKRP